MAMNETAKFDAIGSGVISFLRAPHVPASDLARSGSRAAFLGFPCEGGNAAIERPGSSNDRRYVGKRQRERGAKREAPLALGVPNLLGDRASRFKSEERPAHDGASARLRYRSAGRSQQ